MSQQKNSSIPLIGGVLAAIAASLCCIGPLVLVMLGMGGAWVSSLSVMEPFRPYLLVIAIIFLFFAWEKIYRAQELLQTGLKKSAFRLKFPSPTLPKATIHETTQRSYSPYPASSWHHHG